MSRSNRRCERSLAWLVFLAGANAAFARTDATDVDSKLLFNQKFMGIMSSAVDDDAVEISDVAGSKLTVSVKRDGSNGLKPDVDLLDSNFALIDTSAVKTKGADFATISSFVLPTSGKYYLSVTSINGLTGTYSLTIKGKPPKKPSLSAGTISVAGEVDGLSFVARGGSKLGGSIERTGGALVPLVIEVVSPTGTLVPLGAKGAKLNAAQDAVVLSNISLPTDGVYQLRMTGQGGTTGGYQPKLKVTPPKPVNDVIFEDEHPVPVDDDSSPITLKEVFFGRGLKQSNGGIEVVSPFTTVKTDPVSDLPVPGTLTSIFPGFAVTSAVPFNLDTFYAPMIVPRNASLSLRFNRTVSKSSLRLDGDGVSTIDTPIQVVVNGQPAFFQMVIQGNDLVLNPVYGDNVGMPPSPLAVDASGNPVAANDGAAKLSIVSGISGLTATDGGLYKARGDLLGSPDSGGVAIGFNPGNQVLDFFKQSVVGGTTKSYTGFLPDEARPRIVREQKVAGTYTPNFQNPALGDVQSLTTMSMVLPEALDVSQNGGKGEYANGVFRLRSKGPNREQHVIVSHSVVPLGGGQFRNEFVLATKVQIPLKAPNGADPGDRYEVVRAEYYEPDPENPIDPSFFDPNDPDLNENTQIENFVDVLDRDGEAQDISDPIDPKSTLTIRFDEPMALETFRPYESFFVTDYLGTSETVSFTTGFNYLGRVVASERGKALTFEPTRVLQSTGGSTENVGFGAGAKALQLHLMALPSAAELTSLLGTDGLSQFVAGGRRGVTDLGGQPIALPAKYFSNTEPVADLRIGFSTAGDPQLVEHGAIVHRFLGQPTTASGANGETGAVYADVPTTLCGPLGNIYGPRIADINLFSNGFLSGASVTYFQKIHDDFNPPPEGQLTAFPFGTSTPIGGFSVLGGAKLQHVYRAIDCSPDSETLAGTYLDLTRVDYCPLNGAVASTILPDVSIHVGHSAVVPDTSQANGIPQLGGTGLNGAAGNQYRFGGHFATLGDPTSDYVAGSYDATDVATGDSLRPQLVYGQAKPDSPADFYDGRAIPIEKANLYPPAGSPERRYHPLPAGGFDVPFAYDNGGPDLKKYPPGVTFGISNQPRHHSLILEYRVRVHDATNPPSTQNVFTFASGILSSALPRFRIFTFGAGCSACCNAGAQCQATCATTLGPPFNGLTTGGGAPLDPDRIVNAIGPDVVAPGLPCVCYGTTQNHAPCVAGQTDQTILPPQGPSAHAVALGQATPSNQNNFGDNSRYYMVFNYVKRQSLIRSPFVRARTSAAPELSQQFSPYFLEPIFTPPLASQPLGTAFEVRFRASTTGQGGFDATAFVTPDQVEAQLNGEQRSFIQFEIRSEGNTSTQLVPVLEEVVIPFRLNP